VNIVISTSSFPGAFTDLNNIKKTHFRKLRVWLPFWISNSSFSFYLCGASASDWISWKSGCRSYEGIFSPEISNGCCQEQLSQYHSIPQILSMTHPK